ncbi:uncharacterized protein LOC103255883 [Carlito syrichta]|uniref:Uncharacterized protein LOC103255883 n=1 Tax=Carlito syrichta TaxID=1868482 RepID=A0A1U7TE13_CARSF|nr:uncharacterized protein LOC103255883 [Carlito syrichta]
MSVLKDAITVVKIRCVSILQVLSCASAKLDTSELMIIHVQSMMSASQISITAMKMLYASTLWVDTTVFASQAIRGMEPLAKHFAEMAVGMEEPALPLMCVPAHKASLDPAVKRKDVWNYPGFHDFTIRFTHLEPIYTGIYDRIKA